MAKDKLKKYTPEELAESFVFRSTLTPEEKKESDAELARVRAENKKNMTPEQIELSRKLQAKYQAEDAAKEAKSSKEEKEENS